MNNETWEAIRVLGFWRVLWHRTLYRPVSRLMHRFDLHYAPIGGPDGDVAWCQWCGLRAHMPRKKPGASLL
jgi:hypothetical protein